jgi:L-alanine-DL-glutamate epimerase-like enolase superfamily enzyme
VKIDHVELVNLRYEYPPPGGFAYSAGVCTARFTSLVFVHTDNGLTGVGSAYTHPAMAHLVVNHQLAPLLRGRDPLEVEALHDEMYRLTRWYGRKGAAVSALGGVDTALWDLRAQAAGQPLWKLFGGDRPACPAYASGLLWSTPEALAAEAAGHIEAGFRRVKLRLARSEDYDRAAVVAVRQAIGAGNDLMADASMAYHPELATRMGHFLAEQGVFWYEEPFEPEALDRYAALRGTIGVPLAAGENEFGLAGFRELIVAGAVDIAQPDASRCGGLTVVCQVAELAAEHGLRIATHTWSDAVAIVANAHAVAAAPNGITVEIDRTGTPFVDELLVEPLRVDDGVLRLSERPGLGIQLRDDVVERLRLAEPMMVADGSYSDMMFGVEHLPRPAPYVESVT